MSPIFGCNQFGEFHWPVWAVASCSSGPQAGGTVRLIATEYRTQGAAPPCNELKEAANQLFLSQLTVDAGSPDGVVNLKPDEEVRRDVPQPRTHDPDQHGLRDCHHCTSGCRSNFKCIRMSFTPSLMNSLKRLHMVDDNHAIAGGLLTQFPLIRNSVDFRLVCPKFFPEF